MLQPSKEDLEAQAIDLKYAYWFADQINSHHRKALDLCREYNLGDKKRKLNKWAKQVRYDDTIL